MGNRTRVGNFSVMILISILVSYSIFRLLLPYQDEPDFEFRLYEILLNKDIELLASIYASLYSNFEFYYGECLVDGSVLSVIFSIPSILCGEGLDNKLTRVLIVFFLASMIVLCSTLYLSKEKINRHYGLLTSLTLPGLAYYLGIIGIEQISLVFSLLTYVFISHVYILISLVLILFVIEPGTGIVVSSFLLLRFIYGFIINNGGFRKANFILFVSTFLSLVLGMTLLKLLYMIPVVGPKAILIFEHYNSLYSDVGSKYSILLRPIVTFMTGVFMTPSGLKSIFIYFIYGVSLLKMSYFIFTHNGRLLLKDKINNRNEYTICIAEIYAVVTLVLCYAFVLPGFTNAKYYIFLCPYIFNVCVHIWGRNKVFLTNILSFSLLFASLLYFSL